MRIRQVREDQQGRCRQAEGDSGRGLQQSDDEKHRENAAPSLEELAGYVAGASHQCGRYG